jgi:hypothetical protein
MFWSKPISRSGAGVAEAGAPGSWRYPGVGTPVNWAADGTAEARTAPNTAIAAAEAKDARER